MFAREWPILLVDDEPDVLSVTKLALKNVKVFGLPLAIHTAKSKAEAIELLKTKLTLPNGLCLVAVAFIDVVMESDSAGLELCEFIRKELHNQTTQVYVRTGQPGVAPERAVIDRYDITGYFTKHETTESKLYSLVKSGVRHWHQLVFGAMVNESLHALATVAHSRDGIRQMINASLAGTGEAGQGISEAVFIDGEPVVTFNLDADAGRALRDKLDAESGVAVGDSGDKLVCAGNDFLIKLAGTDGSAEVYVVGKGTAPSPAIELQMFHRVYRTIAQVWKLTA